MDSTTQQKNFYPGNNTVTLLIASHAGVFRGARLGEKRTPLKTPAWEATFLNTYLLDSDLSGANNRGYPECQSTRIQRIACSTVVFSVVTQRDDSENGCVAHYTKRGV